MIREVRVQTTAGHKFAQEISVAGLTLVADEPTDSGGENLGPAPHEWLLAGLGACTSMTIKMYAERKAWPVDSVEVVLRAEHKGGAFVITRDIVLHGALDDEQRKRLIEIANKCPVHKTLSGPISIETHELHAPTGA